MAVSGNGGEAGCSVAVLQPYFFPYLGYFQLLAHVDVFVVYDDTQYVKRSWINRNRILEHGAAAYLTLPVASGSHRQLICEKRLHEPHYHQRKLLTRIRHAYRAAPHLDSVSSFLEPLFPGDDENIASFNVRALRAVQELLGLSTRLVLASERGYPPCRTAQERIIRICLEEGGTRYVNPIRARSLGLYDQAAFTAAGLELSYLSTKANTRYDQNGGPFVSDLSVIDVLMFNSPAQMRELLGRFVLKPPQSLEAAGDIETSPPRPLRIPLDDRETG
jgi:WbqC-like protein family